MHAPDAIMNILSFFIAPHGGLPTPASVCLEQEPACRIILVNALVSMEIGPAPPILGTAHPKKVKPRIQKCIQ